MRAHHTVELHALSHCVRWCHASGNLVAPPQREVALFFLRCEGLARCWRQVSL